MVVRIRLLIRTVKSPARNFSKILSISAPLFLTGTVKVLQVLGCGFMPMIGVLLFVISFEAKRKVPSPPIAITKSGHPLVVAPATTSGSSVLQEGRRKVTIDKITSSRKFN